MEKELIKFFDLIKTEIIDADAVLVRNVSPVGNSGHIVIPKEFIGKFARVIILSEKCEKTIEIRKIRLKEKIL